MPRFRRGLSRGLLATAALLLVALAAAPGPGPPGAALPGAARGGSGAPVWDDEFDGTAGSAPDPARWGHETGGNGSGNEELEYYTAGTGNAALDGDGHLVITARKENPAGYRCWYGSCEYTSARLSTAGRFSQRYGRFEARVKLPRGQGIWPAFWALGSDIRTVGWPECGEIDIMENSGGRPGVIRGSLHGPGSLDVSANYRLPGGAAFADGFHTFAVDWSPDQVIFAVDTDVYLVATPDDTHGAPWVFDHPFYLLLNVAVGGTFVDPPGGGTAFPQRMVVDYVRVYARET
jgi:beta-glucanase (GH16 family)